MLPAPRTARLLAVTYFVAFAVAVTWPGMTPFNRIFPLVLGLPFSLAWIALWVVGGALVLWMVYAAEGRSGARGARGDRGGSPGSGTADDPDRTPGGRG